MNDSGKTTNEAPLRDASAIRPQAFSVVFAALRNAEAA
jgi:hypothetical protein